MKIELHEISIRELTDGFEDHAEDGVVGYGGRLDIRPKYQREFIYSEKQQQAVIDTVMKGFPLNTMYWAVRGDGTFEVIDGQQRTLSICRYVNGDFSHGKRFFGNLQDDERERVMSYRLMVYLCEGTDSEKLEWFKTINIAGEELTSQELRNAVYAGAWTADAKRYFSKSECAAWQLGNKYLTGSPIRQDYLETALRWYSRGDIEGYMAAYEHDASASSLWVYYQGIISWAKTLFPKYRREMKGVEWGDLYNEFGGNAYDPAALEREAARLMADDDVTAKRGIYEYLLSDGKRERVLSIRAFTDSQKRAAYERQKGVCPRCGLHFDYGQMEGDHITPWSEGGHTAPDNLQMLCRDCNRRKGAK
jgi:hypothetical protein